jgi:hypothetical protein
MTDEKAINTETSVAAAVAILAPRVPLLGRAGERG